VAGVDVAGSTWPMLTYRVSVVGVDVVGVNVGGQRGGCRCGVVDVAWTAWLTTAGAVVVGWWWSTWQGA
jgi:hypothetical protein